MREFKITDEQIRCLANTNGACLGIDQQLKKWFPEVFEPEWEEVPFQSFSPEGFKEKRIILHDLSSPFPAIYPLVVMIREGHEKYYKIEKGEIWRRK